MIAGASSLPFLRGGGEMGERIRAFDWRATALGAPDTWPQELRSALSICLNSSVPTAIYWGPDLRLLYNDAWAPIPAEKHPWALGRAAQEVWADIWEVVGPQFAQVIANAEGFSTYDQMLPMQRGGRVMETYWNYSFTPILDDAGRVAGIFNQGHETTAAILARREREAQFARLGEMFEQTPAAVALLNGPRHLFEFANAAYRELVDHRDVIGLPVAEALPEVVGQGFISLLDSVFRSGEPYIGRNISVQLRRGALFETRTLDFIYQPVRFGGGDVTSILVQATDVTERSRAEQALRESEERFRLVAESAPVMLWMSDVDGRCTYLNRAQREFWNLPAAAVGEFPWNDTVHPDDRAALATAYEQSLQTRQPLIAESRIRRGNGEYRVVLTRGEPRISASGEYLGMIGVNVDVTDTRAAEAALQALNTTLEQRVQEEVLQRSRAEDTLRQVQKMEAIGRLTGGIAHDFNNMLAVVIGGLHMLRRRVARGETDVAQYIDGALEGAQRAADLTDRLLSFARRQPLVLAPLDVNRMVAGMSELLSRALGESVQVETRPQPHLWLIRSDRSQLENAILNLAVNARDAMKGNGRLTIETSNAQLDESQAREFSVAPGDYVLVSVSDTGSGMSPEVLARAFEPFFTTKAVGEGTGLGLSQVFGFVSQSGGQVKIESEVGRGTTIRLYLPRFDGDGTVREEDSTPAPIAAGRASEVILVVEDEPRVRAFSTEALRDLGYTVHSVGSGTEALRFIHGDEPLSLMFTDIVMADMTGRQLAEIAARARPAMKVVLTSGYSRDDVPGAVLAKPFGIDELAATIRAALDE